MLLLLLAGGVVAGPTGPTFLPVWAANSNRTLGMSIEPQ